MNSLGGGTCEEGVLGGCSEVSEQFLHMVPAKQLAHWQSLSVAGMRHHAAAWWHRDVAGRAGGQC